ncbi:glycosyltransferase family 2 protein [Mucilaginibacter sp. Bleaf8]|uniref:glycosyltransferase family 92 protein n=1 Tax=Mucilaginibacter sp. Bleaf8 TaxID=2834430 RepID=UPI001BCEB746|nr:glycosyltransferase family 92 protein [Mucilaginibacter sp. Bleaf8]MBS7566153.1 glycosyltransferase family 2 protein [Mucilaginibacter sp. Bleaf8]
MIKTLLRRTPEVYKNYVAICCIVKNENLYFDEWIDYHTQIGVSHFYVYDNESVVPAAVTLAKYIKAGMVTVTEIKGKEKQTTAYGMCLKTYGADCRWIAFIDVDEYIVPKTMNGSLPEFLLSYEKFAALGISWLVFGSNGYEKKPDGLQVNNYTKRSLKTHSENDHIKSIVQPKFVVSPGTDPHHFVYQKKKFCVNENFERINGARVLHTSNKIQINHYFLRSLEEFKRKIGRGRADLDVPRKLNEFYEIDKDANVIVDEAIIELKMLIQANKK